MIDAGPEQTSETGPRSMSNPRWCRAVAISVVAACPTGIGAQGTDCAARQTPPPSWSVAASIRCRDTARSREMVDARPSSVVAFRLRFTISRPPNWWLCQSARTASVSGPVKPTIITAPISCSSVIAPDAFGDGDDPGLLGAEGLGDPHAARTRRSNARALVFTSLLTSRLRGRFLGLPAWLELRDRHVDGIDELVDVALAHRRRQ